MGLLLPPLLAPQPSSCLLTAIAEAARPERRLGAGNRPQPGRAHRVRLEHRHDDMILTALLGSVLLYHDVSNGSTHKEDPRQSELLGMPMVSLLWVLG